MARNGKNRLAVYGETIDFTIQQDRKRGIAELNYSRHDSEGKTQDGLRSRFVVVSCWMNNNNGNAAKAYLIPNKLNPMHRQLVQDIKTLGVIAFGGTGMCLTTDGLLIRYGMKPTQIIRWHDPESHAEIFLYDSKAKALRVVLDGIASYRTLGGLNLVSLNRLPDSLLIESGFVRVDDLLHERRQPRGIPMWAGSPLQAIGVRNEYSDREGAAKSRQQFLDLLNKMLS